MKNKILFWVALVCVTFVSQACHDDESEPVVVPSQTGTMTDKDGNSYHWVRLGDLDWMAENLRAGTPFYEQMTADSSGYLVQYGTLEEAVNMLNSYGNYYTYAQALENCPDGWRLPTDDDWKNLERTLGMKHVDDEGWRDGAADLLVQTAEGGTGLGLKYGGELCKWGYGSQTDSIVKPYRQEEFGLYWTATKDTTTEERVWYRRIMSGLNKVERRKMATFAHYLSVRYVRDAK